MPTQLVCGRQDEFASVETARAIAARGRDARLVVLDDCGHLLTLERPTRKKAEVVDLMQQVADAVSHSGVDEGMCTVFVRHATAAIVINKNADAGFRLDLRGRARQAVSRGGVGARQDRR